MPIRMLLCLMCLVTPVAAEGVAPKGAVGNWHQPAGPNANWCVQGDPPVKWSVIRNENILWRTPMPEAGMSSVTIWGDKAFTTIHVPIDSIEQQTKVKHIIGYCLDANTGKVLWKVNLPGSAALRLAGGFTDGTVFGPITDGEHVWFFNRCGSMGCFDMNGRRVWLREFTPRYKHNNRQCEPMIVGDVILHLEVHDKVNGSKMSKWSPQGKVQKVTIPAGVTSEKDVWTYIHAIDKRTGKVRWREKVGTSVHHTPVFGTLADGTPAVVHARGGSHKPMEKPYGLSLTTVGPKSGRTLWSTHLERFDPAFSSHWNSREVYGFHLGKHIVLDTKTGKVIREQPLYNTAQLWKRDQEANDWILETGATIKAGKGHPNTRQANIIVGDWHYFLSHNVHYVGRVNVKHGKVEYLEVPAQMIASTTTRDADTYLWGKGQKNQPINAKGLAIGRKGHNGTGWGHISAASPTLVGKYLFLPVVTGTVYVIDTSVEKLSPKAFVAINDLGRGGETWSLASLSFANGKLYAHTMREVICIGK